MYRVLFFAELNPNKYGSIEEMILFLGRELTSRGDELFLGVIAYPIPEVAELFIAAGIKIIDLYSRKDMDDNPSIFLKIKSIRQLVRTYKIDLVHINFFALTNPLLLGVYLSPAKIVFTEHTSGRTPSRGVVKQILSRSLHFLITSRVARYIAVSDFVRERLQLSCHVDPEQTITIYNGVNMERFIPLERDKARKMAGLPLQRQIVLAVAMLIPEKGLQHLLHAASILQSDDERGDIYIVIVGEGSFRNELEKQVKHLRLEDHVIFLGRRSDVHLLVAAADVVVVPAVWAEAFGLIIAEAMAGARVVVASRIGGITELIEDQKTGLLVDPGDVAGLAMAIQSLLPNSFYRETLIKNALTKVNEKFNLSQQVVKVADLYRQVMIQ